MDVEMRRRFPRFPTDFPVTVRGLGGDAMYGRCVDIAEGGIGLSLAHDLNVGDGARLELSLFGVTHPIAAQGIVRYRMPYHYYGVEFVDLKPAERQVVARYCGFLAAHA